MRTVRISIYKCDPIPGDFIDRIEETIDDKVISKDTLRRLGQYLALLYDYGLITVSYPKGDGSYCMAGYYYLGDDEARYTEVYAGKLNNAMEVCRCQVI